MSRVLSDAESPNQPEPDYVAFVEAIVEGAHGRDVRNDMRGSRGGISGSRRAASERSWPVALVAEAAPQPCGEREVRRAAPRSRTASATRRSG